MNRITADIIYINKMIIFDENLIKDDIDPIFFSDKLNFDINYTNKLFSLIFKDFMQNGKTFKEKYVLNLFLSSLKRFYKFILKFKETPKLSTEFIIDNAILDKVISNLEELISQIISFSSRAQMVNSERQYINKEEYSLLLGEKEKTL